MKVKFYRDYSLRPNMSDASFPMYEIWDKDDKLVKSITLPSEFEDEVDALIYNAAMKEWLIDTSDEHLAWVVKNEFYHQLLQMSRSYRCENRDYLLKVFNRGRGSVELLRLYLNEGEPFVLVNDAYWNRRDTENLAELFDKLGVNYHIRHAEYGYPKYYNHDFGLKYEVKMKTKNENDN